MCIADDSGLEIRVLNNQPGIYSARWGGKKNNFNLAISKELAIRITDNDAPANSLDKPLTEKKAALKATNNADNPNKNVLNFITKCLPIPLPYCLN